MAYKNLKTLQIQYIIIQIHGSASRHDIMIIILSLIIAWQICFSPLLDSLSSTCSALWTPTRKEIYKITALECHTLIYVTHQ